MGNTTVVATAYNDPRMANRGNSGIAIGLSTVSPVNGSKIQQGKIMSSSSTRRYRGKIVTTSVVSLETAWAMYLALYEMFYEDPYEDKD